MPRLVGFIQTAYHVSIVKKIHQNWKIIEKKNKRLSWIWQNYFLYVKQMSMLWYSHIRFDVGRQIDTVPFSCMYGLFCKEIVYFIFLFEYVFIDRKNVCNIYYYTHYTYSAKLSFKSMYKKSYKIGPSRFNKWNFNVSQFPNKGQFILLKINLLPFHVDSIHYFFLWGGGGWLLLFSFVYLFFGFFL